MELDIFHYLGKSEYNFFFIEHIGSGHCQWSENAKKFFLHDTVDATVVNWSALVHPSDFDAFTHACHDLKHRQKKQFFGEYRFRLHTGSYTWVQCNCSMVEDASGGEPYLSGLITLLQSKSNIDPVTNLLYINSFHSVLDSLASHWTQYGILIIGIDDFKRINHLYSYSFGNQVLARFASDLESFLPIQSQLFRLDGDSFGILHPYTDVSELIQLFDQIQELTQRPVTMDGITISHSISGGISRYPEDGNTSDILYRNARIALVESKHRGKNQVTICSPDLCSQAQKRMLLLEALKESVQNGCQGFYLCYQPLVYAEDESLYGCEVLMRFSHPSFPDGVSPYEFIPILENSGLIFDVNEWLLWSAFTQCAKWVALIPAFQMNINFSCAQFEDPSFKFHVINILAQIGLSTSAITLELTESGEVTDMDAISSVFDFLRSQGIKIALDDFGTGYSSLSIFQMLKVDELKIDRSFLSRLTYNITDQVLIRQIIQLCHGMNMIVCVEGIESEKIKEIVREFRPELLQGFYYNRPLTKDAFEECYIPTTLVSQGEPLCKKKMPNLTQNTIYDSIRPTKPLTIETLVDNAHAGMFQVAMDANFSFITCNEGYRKMLGYTAQDIERKFSNFSLGIIYPDDVTHLTEEIRRQLGEGDTITLEFRVVRADGTPIWVLGTGNVVKGVDGLSSLVVIIIENNRFKLETIAVAKKCRRFEQILSNIPVGVKCVQHNEDFDLDYMSPAFLSLLGYESSDLETMFQKKYIQMILEEDRSVVVADVIDQVKDSNIVTLRYRSHRKNGTPIWVETISRLCPPEEDGIQRWYSSVVNITDSISEEQKQNTRSFAHRIQSATQQWGDVIFEYTFATDSISFSENYETLFHRKPRTEMIEETKHIHPEDQYLLEEAVQMMNWGIHPPTLELRYSSEEKGYFWISIQFTPPYILGGTPISVLGKISNIDTEKKERDDLLMKSRLDGLTGILNKKTLEQDIRAHILTNPKPACEYALCILDIDDFKHVNDTYGHLFGDQVLVNTASRLLTLMGNQGLVGRAGGDEFILYVPLSHELSTTEILGNEIIQQLSQPIDFDGQRIQPLFSVGISTYPKDHQDFYGLYRLADSALYHAKANGKNAYHIVSNG